MQTDSKESLLLVRGDLVKFLLTDGSVMEVPENWGLVQDPSGKCLHPCDLILCEYRLDHNIDATSMQSFNNNNTTTTDAAVQYFGRGGRIAKGSVEIPSGPWYRASCDAEAIFYRLAGRRRGLYHHYFKTPVGLLWNGDRTGCKMVLPDACVLSKRGFIWP